MLPGRCILTGALQTSAASAHSAFAALSAAGVLHFVLGRYCNFRASQAAGVNLTAPVIQLNSVVTLVLAVVILREPCTMLQAMGALLMVSGSLVTQRSSDPPAPSKRDESAFKPRVAVGFFFALIAALAYGTSPIIVRQALQDVGPLERRGRRVGRLCRSDSGSHSRARHPELARQCHDGHWRERSLVRLLGDLRRRGSRLPLLCPRCRAHHGGGAAFATLVGFPFLLRASSILTTRCSAL